MPYLITMPPYNTNPKTSMNQVKPCEGENDNDPTGVPSSICVDSSAVNAMSNNNKVLPPVKTDKNKKKIPSPVPKKAKDELDDLYDLGLDSLSNSSLSESDDDQSITITIKPK